MADRDILYRAIDRVVLDQDRLLVIHSSLIHLQLNAQGLKHTFQAAFSALLERGKTLVLPAFTLSFCRGQPFDVSESQSEVGQLCHWLLEMPGAVRTEHPVYSFVVAGPMSGEVLGCTNTTTFGDDSTFAVFEKFDARIVMLGCAWKKATQFHRYEEEAGVPYRAYQDFEGEVKSASGVARVGSVKMYARDFSLEPVPVNDFSRVVDELRKRDVILSHSLAGGMVESVNCSELAQVCRLLLLDDPLAMTKNRESLADQLDARRNAGRRIDVALLGSANLDILAQAMRQEFSMFFPDFFIKVYGIPFGQMNLQILNPDSQLNAAVPQIAFFAERLEEVLHIDSLDDAPSASVALELVDEYLDLVTHFLETPRRMVVLHRFAQFSLSAFQRADGLIAECNRRLDAFANAHAEIHLFDVQQAALQAAVPGYDERVWRIGRFPYSYPITRILAIRYAGLLLAKTGGTARLIVVDLDNTLWGGVAGEDGVDGLRIGGDFPGNAFAAFQCALKNLSQRGIALAIASKNDADLINTVFAERSEMRLHLDDFAATKIDWNLKWQNVQALADELGLGLGNVLFVDDNPIEREQMRQFLPAVKVLELPGDPTEYTQALLSSPYLSFLKITDEDRKRTFGYRARAAIEGERRKFNRIEDFYASLEIKLHIFPLSKQNIARAEQLAAKTNQFNTTTRRYGARDLKQLQVNGSEVRVIATEDRFSPLENVGLIVLKWNEPKQLTATIDVFLMSCRVLGRGIEGGVLGWARQTALTRGMRSLFGPIVETARNAPVRRVYAEHGFVRTDGSGDWVTDLTLIGEAQPSWLTVLNHDT